MGTKTPSDLAADCAELIGTTGSSVVKINQLLRAYHNVPAELRDLQSQIVASKQTLDRFLPLLDRDQPAFQHNNDVEALDLHLRAIEYVVKDVQNFLAEVEAGRSTPFPEWSSVQAIWETERMAESQERLSRQLCGLEVYLSVSRPEDQVHQLVEITTAADKARLLEAWDDATMYTSAPSVTRLPPEPSVAIDSLHPPQVESDTSTSPITQGSQIVQSSPSLVYSSTSEHTGSSMSSAPVFTSIHYEKFATSMGQMNFGGQRRNSYWRDAIKTQNMTIPSARKLKSMAMLQKPPMARETLQSLKGQRDEINSTDYKSRVSGYASGMSPTWELRNVPANKKETKQRYRNRFTRNPENDLSPEKMQSQFKVTEKELWDAILNREAETVRKIMEHRWTDNLVVEKRDRLTALHLAASLGSCSIVQILVCLGASPNYADRYGATAMHYAADFGCANCLHILALGGGRVETDSPKTHVRTPLFYAARKGNVEAVNALLNLGAHVYSANTAKNETILYAAVESGNLEIIETILDKGGNPSESFDTLALAAATSQELLAFLVKAGANINVHDSNQKTLLYKYLVKSDVDMVSFLLALGANPGTAAEVLGRMNTQIALHGGGYSESAALVKVLLDTGDPPDWKDPRGQTALHLAVTWGRADVAEVLLTHGASSWIPDNNGISPFQETQAPEYERRVGKSTFADYPATKAILERWHRDGVPGFTELHGQPKPIVETASHQPSGKARFEPENTLKSAHALAPPYGPFELPDSQRPVHELQGRRPSIGRKALPEPAAS